MSKTKPKTTGKPAAKRPATPIHVNGNDEPELELELELEAEAPAAPKPTVTTKRPAGKALVSTAQVKKAPPTASKTGAAKPKKKSALQLHRETFSEEGAKSGALAAASASVLGTVLTNMRVKHGDLNTGTLLDILDIVIGIPLPSLSMEYLTCGTVWPLGRVTQTVGLEGSFKSAFQWEISSWFRQWAQGIGTVFENESKFEANYAASYVGPDNIHALGHVPCSSVEDWQTKVQDFNKDVKQLMTGTKLNPGTGRTFAVLGILDSIMGKLSEKTIAKIEKEGHADRRYATEAMFITDFLKKLPSDYEEWPISFNTVNHLKMGKDEMNNDVRRKAGGAQLSFQETFELEMQRVGQKQIVISPNKAEGTPRYDGRSLRIKCFKNGLGDTGRDIPVNVLWHRVLDEKTGEQRQISFFDWHSSSINLLTKGLQEHEQKRLKQVLHITRVAGTSADPGEKVFCPELGISKNHPVSVRKAGDLLHENTEVTGILRRHFGITIRRRFKPGVDYRIQLNGERARVQKKVKKLEDGAEEV